MGNYTQVGTDTFRRTAEMMRRVQYLANEIGRPGGTIESMLKFLNPNQSAARDRQLKLYISRGQDFINESVDLIATIRADFNHWKELTTGLLRALEKKTAINAQQKRVTERKLSECSKEKNRNEVELEEQRKSLEEIESRYQTALQIYENLVRNLPSSISRAGAVVTAAAAVGLSPEILVVGLVTGGFHYLVFEVARQRKISTVQRLEQETSNLKSMLLQLSGEAKSIAEVGNVVRQALGQLSDLQLQIDIFMEFLMNIQTMIKEGTDRRDCVLKPGQSKEERKEEWEDVELKKVILSESYVLKTQFLLASKASELYNEVSNMFVIPGINWLAANRLKDLSTSEDAVEKRVAEIEEWRTKICLGAENLTMKATELKESLDKLARDSTESFKRVAPDLWTATVTAGTTDADESATT
ncbi:hypothetical protein BGZ60DRAFT_561106 [Tricladium varicosporioides]|nr:hypothetical protein BGZ60DRAFT_561106 [Hymenoscyphus varicosporioides]